MQNAFLARRKYVLFAVLALVALALVIPQSSFGQTRQVSMKEYVAAQSSFSYSCGWDEKTGDILCLDFLGKRAQWFNLNLGTSVSGGATIRDLKNGLELVSVEVITTDAICWGFYSDALTPAFGTMPRLVAQGATPSLGSGHVNIDYIQPAGPLADLATSPDITLLSFKLNFMCPHGELQPSGVPGFAQAINTGLFDTGVPGGCPPEKPEANCYPAEKVQFKPTGR